MFRTTSAKRPLPLKQRTSSLDTRRDYSHNTWWSLLVLLKVREYFVTVDNFSIWRRHIAWAMEDGKDLRAYMTQRYGSSMVVMSLLLSTELAILFNSAPVTTHVREALREGRHLSISFWAGFMIMTSSILTILSLIALFTAWGMVNSIDEVNTHCIFRSSIGQYAAELPGRLIVCSIYSFLISFMMFFFLLLPVGSWSITLSALTAFLFFHIVSTFSAFGRIIMHTGAMSNARIFTPEFEDFLLPHSLHANLLIKAQANLAHKASIIRQYRRKQQPIDRHLTPETMYDHLSANLFGSEIADSIPYRPRADSTVRFADVEQGSNNNQSTCYSHIRTLTPLSDSSSCRLTDQSSLLNERATPTYSSLRKTSFSGPLPRHEFHQNRLSPIPSGCGSTVLGSKHVESGSTSSLDQWLQNTTPSSREPACPNPSNRANETDNLATIPTSMKRRSPSPSFTAATNTSVDSMGRPIPTPTYVMESPSSTTNRLTTAHSMLSFDDRNLSEDERFAMDYGDFDDDDLGSPLRAEYTASYPPPIPILGPSLKHCQENENERLANYDEQLGLLDHSELGLFCSPLSKSFSGGDESSLKKGTLSSSPPPPVG